MRSKRWWPGLMNSREATPGCLGYNESEVVQIDIEGTQPSVSREALKVWSSTVKGDDGDENEVSVEQTFSDCQSPVGLPILQEHERPVDAKPDVEPAAESDAESDAEPIAEPEALRSRWGRLNNAAGGLGTHFTCLFDRFRTRRAGGLSYKDTSTLEKTGSDACWANENTQEPRRSNTMATDNPMVTPSAESVEKEQRWIRRHWKLVLVISVVTAVFVAVGLSVVLAVVVPRQIEKLLRTSVLLTESTEIASVQSHGFRAAVKGQLISSTSVSAVISASDQPIRIRQVVKRSIDEPSTNSARLRRLETTEAVAEAPPDEWHDPFSFVKPTDHVYEVGHLTIDAIHVAGSDQTITGTVEVTNDSQLNACVKDLLLGYTQWWLLEGTAHVHVAGITFHNIPFNRVFKLKPPSALDSDHVLVKSVNLMEPVPADAQKAILPLVVEGDVKNTGQIEVADFGSARFEMIYNQQVIGELHTPHLGYLQGLNPLLLRGRLIPGAELQRLFSNYLHGVDSEISITIKATEDNALQKALEGLSLKHNLPGRPSGLGSLLSHMYLEKIQLSPEICQSRYTPDRFNRVVRDDGSVSRRGFPPWPEDLVLQTPSYEERNFVSSRSRRHRRLWTDTSAVKGKRKKGVASIRPGVDIPEEQPVSHGRMLQETGFAVGEEEQQVVESQDSLAHQDSPVSNILSVVFNVVSNSLNGNSEQSDVVLPITGPQNGPTMQLLANISKAIGSTVLQAVRGSTNRGIRTVGELGSLLTANKKESVANPNGTVGISVTAMGVVKWKEPVETLIERALSAMGTSLPIETTVLVGFWSPFHATHLLQARVTGELSIIVGARVYEGNLITAEGSSELISTGTDRFVCERSLQLYGNRQSADGLPPADERLTADATSEPVLGMNRRFVLGSKSRMGLIEGQYAMERVKLKSSLTIDPESLTTLGAHLLEANGMWVRMQNLDLAAEVNLNGEHFDIHERNASHVLTVGGRATDETALTGGQKSQRHPLEVKVRRLSIPSETPELTVVVELAITSTLPLAFEIDSPLYLNWMSQDIVGGPVTIPKLHIKQGANDVIAYVGFYRDRLGSLILPMALQMYRENSFNICIAGRDQSELSPEELDVQLKTGSIFSDALNTVIDGLQSYCTQIPLGKSESQMLAEVFLPFVTQLTKTIHV